MSIRASVSEALTTHLPQARKFIMGVSGGPDSMALLYLFYILKKNVLVVHINYGMRAEESDKDQELVEGMASAWGYECCTVRLDSESASGNFQNWAREQRYQIFRDLSAEFGADAIVIAHHQDDQIETILQKLFRGSGSSKWQGLNPWDGEVLRPLLICSKKDILDFCEQEAVPYRIDKSNFEEKYARNILRGSLSERLDDFFPGWKSNVLALSERGKEAEQALEFVLKNFKDENQLQISGLESLPKELQSAVIKRFIELETEGSLTRGMVEEVSDVIHLQVGTRLQLPNGKELIRDRSALIIKNKAIEKLELIISREDAENGIKFKQHVIKQADVELSSGVLSLDFDCLKWPVTLRSWQEGDRFIPLGLGGSQKVSDHLVNRKVNASEKHEALILGGADGTIYALLFPGSYSKGQKGTISELVKVTENTISTLTITL